MNNVTVSRQCQSIDFEHDRICESYLWDAEKTNIFPRLMLSGDFPVVFPAPTLSTWQQANLPMQNIGQEKGPYVLCVNTINCMCRCFRFYDLETLKVVNLNAC